MGMSHQTHLASTSCSTSCLTAETLVPYQPGGNVSVSQLCVAGRTAEQKELPERDTLICTEIICARTSPELGFASRLKCSYMKNIK